MRSGTLIGWGFTRRALVALAILSAACDRQAPTGGQLVPERDRSILGSLERAGYRGPVLIAERTPIDDRGTGPTTRVLFLPREGHARLRATIRHGAEVRHSVGGTLSPADEPSVAMSADDVDQFHNVPATFLRRMVNPSRLNGENPIQSRVVFNSIVFYSYDYETDGWYQVPGGEVLQTVIEASDSSSGHWHGSADTIQLRRKDRVGYMKPATGTFTGSWAATWYAPEFSQQVDIRYRVREIGGPNDGHVDIFSSDEHDAARLYGLVRLPQSDEYYSREGGTSTHPEDFNDWGTPQMIASIQAMAKAYYEATGSTGKTRVNDIALFYGGRFDIGRKLKGRPYEPCSDANTTACWGYSHYEHRYGTEVDINPERNATKKNRATFVGLLQNKFASFVPEGDHFHARVSQSPYGK